MSCPQARLALQGARKKRKTQTTPFGVRLCRVQVVVLMTVQGNVLHYILQKTYPKELFAFNFSYKLDLDKLVEGAISERQIVVVITASVRLSTHISIPLKTGDAGTVLHTFVSVYYILLSQMCGNKATLLHVCLHNCSK